MDCDGCLERLYSYLDRELSPVEVTDVRSHLDECGGCDDTFVIDDKTVLITNVVLHEGRFKHCRFFIVGSPCEGVPQNSLIVFPHTT